MAIDVDNLQAFTDAELLKLYRWALANNAAGQTRQIEGRSVSFPPLLDLMKAIDWLEKRIEAAGNSGDGNTILVQFGDQV